MSAKNRALSERWFREVWNDRRTETIEELMSPDGIGHMESGDLVGTGPFRRVRDQFLSAFPDLKFEIEDTVADGNDVVVRWKVSGTHTGEGLGIPPCHRRVSARGMTWHRYENGAVVEGWDSWNQGAFLQHLRENAPRVVPAPGLEPHLKEGLAERLLEIRQELFGDRGGPELARRLGVTARVWRGYETGTTVPAEVLLGFFKETGADPHWLLTGEGPRYQNGAIAPEPDALSSIELIRQGLKRLEMAAAGLDASPRNPVAGRSRRT